MGFLYLTRGLGIKPPEEHIVRRYGGFDKIVVTKNTSYYASKHANEK